MEKPERFIRIPILNAKPGANNAQCVRRDSNRNTQEHQQNPLKIRFLQEVSIKNRERPQAHERPDTATSLCDLERHRGQLNNISLAQHRHIEQGKDLARELGSQYLQRISYLVEDDRGYR